MANVNRRRFLVGGAGAAAAAAGSFSALETIFAPREARAAVTPAMVRLRPEIEPVVRWIEETPRERILEVATEKLGKGLPYRELQAGLFLAGIRNVQPRPVGFKFHAVMVINSAHQLSLDSPPRDRLYPFLWALDYFKGSQAADARQGDWALAPVDESALPKPTLAARRFTEAMEHWDTEELDRAVTALARTAGASEIRELFWQYGARNFRNIGHNIIFTAHSFRTLDVIGWQHAEPVLRSLAYGLLHGEEGEASEATFKPNRELAGSIRSRWRDGKPDEGATVDLLDTMRHASPIEAGREVAALLDRGVATESLWDGIMLAANELSMRKRGIIALHAATSANSMHHAFTASGGSRTRLLMLLQAASFTAFFREEFERRGGDAPPEGTRIDSLAAEPGEAPEVAEVFRGFAGDRSAAVARAFAYAERGGSIDAFKDMARALIFRKGNDVHDYKFAAAAFEEHLAATPRWRPHLMAASVCNLKASDMGDSRLRVKIEAALEALA